MHIFIKCLPLILTIFPHLCDDASAQGLRPHKPNDQESCDKRTSFAHVGCPCRLIGQKCLDQCSVCVLHRNVSQSPCPTLPTPKITKATTSVTTSPSTTSPYYVTSKYHNPDYYTRNAAQAYKYPYDMEYYQKENREPGFYRRKRDICSSPEYGGICKCIDESVRHRGGCCQTATSTTTTTTSTSVTTTTTTTTTSISGKHKPDDEPFCHKLRALDHPVSREIPNSPL